MKYKAIMFLTLLIFCVGSVCATDQDNTTSTNLTDNVTGDGGLNPVNPPINNTSDIVKMVNSELEKRDSIIQNQDLRIKKLENSSAEKNIKINELNKTVNGLKTDNEALKYNNIQLDKRVKNLEDSNNQLNKTVNNQNGVIKELKDSNKALNDKIDDLNNEIKLSYAEKEKLNVKIDDLNNEIKLSYAEKEKLNVKIDNQNKIINNQTVIINELNTKLDLQFIEIKGLQADKDILNGEINKLNGEIKQIYEKLLSSPKKEEYEQLKKDITDKNNKIKELTVKIDKLNSLLSVSGNDVCNSLKHLSITNIQNIKCGKYTFSLDEYLKIPLIKEGKDRVLKYKKTHGRLPIYVTIAGYDVPKDVYKKIFNIK